MSRLYESGECVGYRITLEDNHGGRHSLDIRFGPSDKYTMGFWLPYLEQFETIAKTTNLLDVANAGSTGQEGTDR